MWGERPVGLEDVGHLLQFAQGSAVPKAFPRYKVAFALDGELWANSSSPTIIVAFGSCIQELSCLLKYVYSFWHILSFL